MKYLTLFSLALLCGEALSGFLPAGQRQALGASHAEVATATAAAAPESSSSTRKLQNEFEDDDPWPNGTPVYYEYKGEWYSGEITNYFDGVYTITWIEDGEVEYFDDPDVIDKMVTNAQTRDNPDLYDIGTPVRMFTTDGNKWLEGVIADFQDGTYRVQWNDGSVNVYAPGPLIDGMVVTGTAADPTAAPTAKATAAAATAAPTAKATSKATTAAATTAHATVAPNLAGTTVNPTDADTSVPTDADSTEAPTDGGTAYVPWELGTDVYKFFPGDGWYWGQITWYENGVYTISWEDNTYEKYNDLDKVDAMVDAANKEGGKDDTWETGIAVFKVFPGEGPFFGEIIAYSDGEYTIRWSDDSIELYSADETDDMVAAAYQKVEEGKASLTKSEAASTESTTKASGGAIFLVVLLVVGGVLGAAYFVQKYRTGKETERRNISSSSYKDEPDADAPIEVPDVI